MVSFMLELIQNKLSEPQTLITDGMLGLQCIIYALILLSDIRKKKTTRNDKFTLLWCFFFSALSVFAFAGSISHYTTNLDLYQSTWSITLFFGGLALFIFHFIIGTQIAKITPKLNKMNLILIFLGYLSFNGLIFGLEWNFTYFGYYLVYICIHFYLSYALILRKSLPFNQLNKKIFIYLSIILFLGIIQVIGKKVQWMYYFGDESQFLF
jgi:hypothetical protein